MRATGRLTPGQDAAVNLLAKLLASAKRGEIDAVAVVACGADGRLDTDIKGAGGFECQINMALDHLKAGIRMQFLQSCAAPSAPSIITPDHGLIVPQ